ncbi:MAG: hypothetical protein JNL23_12680 [Chitinophagaceae bacterium]|nr:hypothetical protein [Chitinophagaceae bacterium]
MRIIRIVSLFLSLLMLIIIGVLGFSSFNGSPDSLLIPVSIIIYYIAILLFWKKYDDITRFKTANLIFFILSLLPVIGFIILLFFLSTIEC